MYKIFVTIALLFLLVGCFETSESSHKSTVDPLVFAPIKILDIKYENKNRIRTLAIDGNIYAVGDGEDNISIGKINPSGSYEELSTINDINKSSQYEVLISIDRPYILLGDKSPNIISLYKILEDQSVKKIVDIKVEETSSLTYAGNMMIKDNTIAVSELRYHINTDTWNANFDHKVVIYRLESNESVTRVQELKSDLVDANESSLFGEDFVLSSDTLAVAERCYIHIFKKDENGTFTQTDTKIFAESNGDEKCYLHLSMRDNHLLAQSHSLSRVFLYQLDNFKFKTAQEIIPETRYRNFGRQQAFIDDKLILSSAEGLSIYTLEDLDSESRVTKYSDINISADFFAASDKYFLATKSRQRDIFSIFDSYPLNKIFLYNDVSKQLKVDEGEIYSILNIDANSITGDLSFSLSGVDATYFELRGNSLVNRVAFDFDNPVDSDMNNVYELTLSIRDKSANKLDIKLNILVMDREFMFKTRVVADDNNKNRVLGKEIAIDGTNVLVGANNSAYLFDANSSLKQILKIDSSTTQSDSKFGSSVAIDGNGVLIGAYLEDINETNQGSATLFTLEDNKSIKTQVKIVSPLLEKYAQFGQALDIQNSVIAIGAPGYGYSYRGYAKVFVYTKEVNGSVTFAQTVESPDSLQLDYFGASIDLDGEYLLVGSPRHAYNHTDGVGSAYLYKRQADNSFKIVDTLVPNTSDYGQYFASSLAMSGEYIVIGAPKVRDVYIFKLDITGEHANRVTTIHNDNLSRFGINVSIKGKDIFIVNDESSIDRVDHYVIEDNDTVTLREVIVNHSDVAVVSRYASVAQGEGFVVTGAAEADINATDSGVITLFEK